ncbi:hypothetical protein HMPREF1531_01700 [Propionibacterium sp. oral taxon 192 str. F0372]|uniref:hypothetical protein n=1 Tax=Propionibacterium sp. oral taxon 192 TaxID=671222 RepID=UPI0003532D25|nr:hypothetical protein [Propionibacterium sp. oral taxon 192]EPH02394.1 hypothetical protein HMPREF1531_01700 [Propionibacterium sp. oral taxon 192 str. F0372]
MTVDLFFVQSNSAASALDQLRAELGLHTRIVAERTTTMEIFPVHVSTVELEPGAADLVTNWFTNRGIHWFAR